MLLNACARRTFSPAVFTAALAWDALLGEPPASVHPVVKIGQIADSVRKWALAGAPGVQFAKGAVVALAMPVVVGSAVQLGMRALAPQRGLQLLWQVYWLKSSFAYKALGAAGRDMTGAVASQGLPRARGQLRHLCSRERLIHALKSERTELPTRRESQHLPVGSLK